MQSSDFSIYDYIDFIKQIEHHKNQELLANESASNRSNKILNPENKNININIPNATIRKFHHRSKKDIEQYNEASSTESESDSIDEYDRKSTNTKKNHRSTTKQQNKKEDEGSDTDSSESSREIITI